MVPNKPLPRLKEALRQFEEATGVIRRYDRRYHIEGEAAQATATALVTTCQKLKFVCIALPRSTEPGDPSSDWDDALRDARRAFQESHPDAPGDFLERLEQALAAAESLPPAKLSEGAQSILRQLGEDVSPVDRDLVQVALGKLDTIQPIMTTLER